MPVEIPYEAHGACLVALIALKGQPKRFYHFSKTAEKEESWALRDYLTGEILRAGDSTLTATQIENLVEHAAEPEYRSVKLIPRWQTDCRAASEHHFGKANVDTTTGNGTALGRWTKMNKQGS
jgi:hypothetical protein